MYKFNAEKTKDEVVAWIRDWFDINGRECNAVIGISGGVDSSVVASLCVEAHGKFLCFDYTPKEGFINISVTPLNHIKEKKGEN